LGGLTRINSDESTTETPFLSKIPILGYLFKSKGLNFQKTNLAVFISPTIVNPKLRSGQSKFTADKVNSAYEDLSEGQMFDSLRDPITKWFFKDKRDDHQSMLTEYVKDAAPNQFVPQNRPADAPTEVEMIEINKLKKLLAEEKNPLTADQTTK
jgi:general secretion pathway protein D